MILLFGVPSVVLAAVTPDRGAPARARAGVARAHRGTALLDLDLRKHRRDVRRPRSGSIPELGVDQLLALMAAALFVAAGVVAFAERLGVPLGVPRRRARGAVVASFALAPEAGGTLVARRGAELVAGLPAPASARRARRSSTPARSCSRRTPSTTGSRSSTPTRHAPAAVRQLVPERDVPRATRTRPSIDYTDYMQLGLAYNPAARNVLMVGLGGGTAPSSGVARDFPDVSIAGRRDRPGGRGGGAPVLPRAGGRPAAARRRPGRPPVTWPRHDQRWDVIMLDTYYCGRRSRSTWRRSSSSSSPGPGSRRTA